MLIFVANVRCLLHNINEEKSMEEYNLSNIIKNRRKELKLSPEIVANACGVHRATYNRWENGFTKDIKRSHILILSQMLYLPLEVLLGLDEKVEIEKADIVLKRNEIIKQLNDIKDINKLENIKKYIEVFVL